MRFGFRGFHGLAATLTPQFATLRHNHRLSMQTLNFHRLQRAAMGPEQVIRRCNPVCRCLRQMPPGFPVTVSDQ